MKKQVIIGIIAIACVALCAAVWSRSAGVEDLSAEPSFLAVNAEIEARSEDMSHIILSADTPAPVTESAAKCEPKETEIITGKETEPAQLATPKSKSAPANASDEPKSGNKKVIDGKPYIYVPGFGWIEDHSGEGGETFAADMYENGNKIGVMGGGTTVGNPGDELTGNKVGIMGGAVSSSGDINKQVGIMGGAESAPSNSSLPPSAEPEPIGGVIYVELQPSVTKDSIPPQYKPNGEPINP